MKLILFIIIFISLVLQPISFGQVFDTPGLVNRFPIKTDGRIFEVKTVTNFDIPDYQFNSDEKRLSFIISSNVQNNLAEFEIPKNLLGGNFTFFLNDQEISTDLQTNEKISFISVEFPGRGLHKFDIIGTTYLSETNDALKTSTFPSKTSEVDFGLLFLIIGIIAASTTGGVLFLKKRKNSYSLTKD